MSNQLPVAVINGIDRFGAIQLAKLLIQNDIKVYGVGEYNGNIGYISGLEFRNSLGEIDESTNYWFDFEESKEAWARAENDKAKLTVVGVNRTIVPGMALKGVKTNWRVVNIHGVYGAGIDQEKENTREVDYLIEAIKLTVANKNLRLPEKNVSLRLLAIEDIKEAISRATFLSGTEYETFSVWGKETNSEEIAKVLIDKGKMTRFKVEEKKFNLTSAESEEVFANWKKLRWQPTVEFDEGIEETLQYFFSKIDEESRKKNNKETVKVLKQETVNDYPVYQDFKEEEVEVKKPDKRFEVMVEEEPKEKETVKYEVEEVNVKENYAEDDKIIEEEYEEIKPLIMKKEEIEKPVLELKPQIIINEEKKPEEKPKIKLGGIKTGAKKYGLLIAAGILGLIVILGMGFILKNYQIVRNILEVRQLVENRDFKKASNLAEKTINTVRKEEITIDNWGGNKWLWGRRYQEGLKIAEQSLVLSEKVISLSERAEKISEAIFTDKDIKWNEELTALKDDLRNGESDLGILQARLSGDWNWLPGRWKNNLNIIKNQLDEATKLVSLAEKSMDFIPQIIGVEGKRKDYMVLLQNESELRAGGGFIGSWAALNFEGGKLLNFEVEDIYEADGQLKGHVEPPLPIKNHLGEANWFMRDANWQADFPTAAKDIQWFLEKETGRKVDGVIGVNLAVAKALLEVVGEIYVPDFKEKINKDNLYEQAEFYSETNSFPGSTQKASFLGAVGKQLFESIKTLKPEKKLLLAKAMIRMLENNEIQIALNDSKTAAIVANLGWNGAIYNGKCATDQCFADYLYVVESNFGVNKANYFIYRSIDQTVDITENTLGRVVKITYENTSTSKSWPGGDYKNYLRVYIPESSNLAEVSVSETNEGAKKILQSNDLTINTIKGKKEIGFLVTVPTGSKRVVEIRYADSLNLSKQKSFSYLDYIQKQSGFGDTALVSLVSIPNEWQPVQVEPSASLVNGKLLFNQKLSGDIKMGVEISK